MLVISRNSAFTYKDKPVNAKQIGRELGVRYVLEGSVQRSASQVRVNAQLINAETDAHLWAERFDGDMGDLFALQNDITNRIAVAFHTELISAEAARPKEQPDALDYVLQGRAARLKPNSRNVYAEVISLYERALTLDPRSVEAQTRLAEVLADRVLDGMSSSGAADIARAEGLVRQALAVSPQNAAVHFAKGEILRAQGRFREAIPEFETVLTLDRNSGWALFALAHCKLRIGSVDEVIPLVEQAIRLSPRDPSASASVARRRGNPLARKGTRRQFGIFLCSRFPRGRLRPKRRGQRGCLRTRRSPPTDRKRFAFQHRARKGYLLGWVCTVDLPLV